jgi:plasmid stabilization system protein ParE
MGWQVIIAPSAQTDLADFPEIGRMVPEFRQPNLREIICRSYRIIYRL